MLAYVSHRSEEKKKKRANLISWDEAEDGGAEPLMAQLQYELSLSHTHTMEAQSCQLLLYSLQQRSALEGSIRLPPFSLLSPRFISTPRETQPRACTCIHSTD